MSNTREVDFFEISPTKSVLDEIEEDLTVRQFAKLDRSIQRLEKHGWALDGTFFRKVHGTKEALREFRLTLEKVEYRILFTEEPCGVFVMLAGYKEKANSIPPGRIRAAEQRIVLWRKRRVREATVPRSLTLREGLI